jgi:hypothetical protein
MTVQRGSGVLELVGGPIDESALVEHRRVEGIRRGPLPSGRGRRRAHRASSVTDVSSRAGQVRGEAVEAVGVAVPGHVANRDSETVARRRLVA